MPKREVHDSLENLQFIVTMLQIKMHLQWKKDSYRLHKKVVNKSMYRHKDKYNKEDIFINIKNIM